eukprot:scaffold1590_cov140-Cylindrotheca_fusiformis.AAC.2
MHALAVDGFAYAGEFMDRGYDVVIYDVKDCSAAGSALESRHPNGKENLGTINYWINNAGINGAYGRRDFRRVPIDQVELVVKVNLIGTLYCTKVAMDIIGEQSLVGVTGRIFNTVGSGVKGGGTPGYACYGVTKRGLPQLTATLVKELNDGGTPGYPCYGVTKRGLPQLTATLVKELNEGVQGYDEKKTAGTIQVHSLSPGMVFTKLLLDNSTPERASGVSIRCFGSPTGRSGCRFGPKDPSYITERWKR